MYYLFHGDCLAQLKKLADNSIDAIVTDPPYGLSDHKPTDVTACLSAWLAGEPYLTKKRGFMGNTWDSWVPGPEVWRECFRVLKAGGHILAFAGSRTHDLMSIALRLAGFECRDTVMWVYASGFPKSVDVSKAIDKAAGAEREVVSHHPNPAGNKSGGSSLNMSVVGMPSTYNITAPSTEAARQWEGWGTALKPAYEPVLLFRKPLSGTVAENVLKHGTGGLNIDGCRVDTCDGENRARPPRTTGGNTGNWKDWSGGESEHHESGRWPANFIHDGSEDVLALFPHTGASKSRVGKRSGKTSGVLGEFAGQESVAMGHDDNGGSAARFFYCSKASKRDRDEGLDKFDTKRTGAMRGTVDNSMKTGSGNPRETYRANTHPTVKPTDLMRYLCRLVTPPNGVILDPFMGSGSTGKAAMLESFNFVGIEREAEYLKIAEARISQVATPSLQLVFDL